MELFLEKVHERIIFFWCLGEKLIERLKNIGFFEMFDNIFNLVDYDCVSSAV